MVETSSDLQEARKLLEEVEKLKDLVLRVVLAAATGEEAEVRARTLDAQRALSGVQHQTQRVLDHG